MTLYKTCSWCAGIGRVRISGQRGQDCPVCKGDGEVPEHKDVAPAPKAVVPLTQQMLH